MYLVRYVVRYAVNAMITNYSQNCILKRFESKHTSCLIAQTPVQAVAIDKKQFYASIIDAGKDSIDDQIIAKLKLHAAQQYSDEQVS